MMKRRHFLGISAAAAGLPLLPFGSALAAKGADRWTGTALGARSEILLNLAASQDSTATKAAALFQRIEAETARLESIFSVYQGHSVISRLNRDGYVDQPPFELVTLLQQAQHIGRQTDGLFDVTVQPLWKFHRQFQESPLPLQGALNQVLPLVNYQAITITADRISFNRPGMAITLNGIAQGYITDRITALLKQAGMTNCLVQMGEIRAEGLRHDGQSWKIGLDRSNQDNPQGINDARTSGVTIPLANQAIATSSNHTRSATGHILNPRSGMQPLHWQQLSVIANDAATADALSTAFSLMDTDQINTMREHYPDIQVLAAARGKALALL